MATMQSVLSLILGGGRGARLYPLTKLRSKPAVPVAGKYRLIDIPISNCINSGLSRIYVLTQFLSVSLHRHIANTYKFDMFGREFVEILAAQQTNETKKPDEWWYQGTADAVRQNKRQIVDDSCEHVLILAGDQLYRMDFRQMLKTHIDSGADATVAALPVARDAVEGLGILKMNDAGRITGFVEKPRTEAELSPFFTPSEWIESRAIPCNGRNYLASMGIYMFRKQALLDMLEQFPLVTDFGKEIFPRDYNTRPLHVHLFDGYWEDLGTIKSYHDSSLALASNNPPFNFYSPEGVIYTRMRFLPAARIEGATLEESLVSDGCVVGRNTKIVKSLLGVRARIGSNVRLDETVMIGADRFEDDADLAKNRLLNRPDFNVGDNSIIKRAILDKDCRVGKGVKILNRANVRDVDTELYSIHDGIVVIPRGVIIPDGTEI